MVNTRSAVASAGCLTPSQQAPPPASRTTQPAGVAATQSSGGSADRIKVLVTGGSGFLGTHLVWQLLETGRYDVTVLDIRASTADGVRNIVGDLRKPEDVAAAVAGQQVVMHCATASPTSENALNKALMQGVNVDGTRHILEACAAAGVQRLVYTSSASVVFEGKPLDNVDESMQYASKPFDHYTYTKIVGEKLVLEANGKGGVATCALRPSGIFGEGDPLFVPSLIRNAKAGKSKFIIGDGSNKMDFTYVGNVAQAHIQAAEALSLVSPLAGQAYFITNGQPLRFWDMMGDVCDGLGYPRPKTHLPYLLIMLVAVIFEHIVRPLVAPFKQVNSDFTVNRILLATTGRTFSPLKAERDFAYKPTVSMQEALQKTLQSFQHLRAESLPVAATESRKEA